MKAPWQMRLHQFGRALPAWTPYWIDGWHYQVEQALKAGKPVPGRVKRQWQRLENHFKRFEAREAEE